MKNYGKGTAEDVSSEWITTVKLAMDQLERDGFIHKTGHCRNGHPTYTLTELGRSVVDD
jgi:DNA-binding HxlR family transcriptional regulator